MSPNDCDILLLWAVREALVVFALRHVNGSHSLPANEGAATRASHVSTTRTRAPHGTGDGMEIMTAVETGRHGTGDGMGIMTAVGTGRHGTGDGTV